MQNLNDLYYFAAVVDHGGFSSAGRALGIQKSKLSRRVLLLEERLGVRLLNRSSRRFAVTEIGREFYERCVAMLIEAEAAEQVIAEVRAEPRGVVRMSCPTALLSFQFGELVARFMMQYPGVQVHLESTNRRVDVIAEGFDLAIRVRLPPLEPTDLVMRQLDESTQCLVAAPALVDGATKSPGDLHNLPSLDQGPPHRDHAWHLLRADGQVATVPHSPRLVTDDMSVLRDAALAGAGAVQLPTIYIWDDVRAGRLVHVLPDWRPKAAIVHAIFPRAAGSFLQFGRWWISSPTSAPSSAPGPTRSCRRPMIRGRRILYLARQIGSDNASENRMEGLETQGIALPRLGLGTYRMDDRSAPGAVESALRLGYRHVDTAAMYDNETGVGAGIAAAGLPRDSVHVTTKVWYDSLTPGGIRKSLDESLKKLKLDFVDLYLVHWPAPRMDLPAIFETLVRLREEGLTRALGVCNFTVPLLRRAVDEIGAPVACNQVEYHVMLDQTPLRRYMVAQSMPLIAYCPLAQGNLAESEELTAIGRKHGASAAQVALKWLLEQEGVAAIPKAQRPASQQANLDALKIVLDADDRRLIAGLPKDRRCVDPSFAPEWDKPEAA